MSPCWHDPAEPRAGFKPQGDAEVDLGGPEAAHTPPLLPHGFPGTQQRGREAWPPPSAAHKIGRQRPSLGLWRIPCFLQINWESNTEQWLALLQSVKQSLPFFPFLFQEKQRKRIEGRKGILKEGRETDIFKPTTAAFQGPLGELNASEPLYVQREGNPGRESQDQRKAFPAAAVFLESCRFEDVLQLLIAHFQKAALYSFLLQVFLLS